MERRNWDIASTWSEAAIFDDLMNYALSIHLIELEDQINSSKNYVLGQYLERKMSRIESIQIENKKCKTIQHKHGEA